MISRAADCSDAVHKALFPRADAIHRMANSRRQIEEIIRAHFPEVSPVADVDMARREAQKAQGQMRQLTATMDIGMFIYQGTWRGVLEHIRDVWRGRPPKRYALSLYSNAESLQFGYPHATSDPTHVAD